MEFVSNINITFVTSVNRKYNKKFRTFDEYSLFIFDLVDNNELEYYYLMEEDLKEYCKYQQERKNTYGKSKN